MTHTSRRLTSWREGGAGDIPLLPFPLLFLTILVGCGVGCNKGIHVDVRVSSDDSATTSQIQEIVGQIIREQWDSVANYYGYQATARGWHTRLFQELFTLSAPPVALPVERDLWLYGISVKLLSFYPIDTTRWVFLIVRRIHPPLFAIYWGEGARLLREKTVELTVTSQVSSPVVMAASPEGTVFFTWFLHDTIWSIHHAEAVPKPFAILRYPSFLLRSDTSTHVVDMYWSINQKFLYILSVSHSHNWSPNYLSLLRCNSHACTLLDTLTLPFDLPYSTVTFHGNNCLGNTGTHALIASDTSIIVMHPYAPLLIRKHLNSPATTDTLPLPISPDWALYRSVDSSFASSYQLSRCGQPASQPDLSPFDKRSGFFKAIGIVRGTTTHLLYYSLCAPAPHEDTSCHTYALVSVYPFSFRLTADSVAFFVSSSRTMVMSFLGMMPLGEQRSTVVNKEVILRAPADLACINCMQGGGDCSLLSDYQLLCFALLPPSIRSEQTFIAVKLRDVIVSPKKFTRSLFSHPQPTNNTLTFALFSRNM